MTLRIGFLAGALALALSVSIALPACAEGPAASWSAPATTQVVEEALSFQGGDATLSGTLYLPRDGGVSSAVVVTHGAGLPLRTARLYQHLTAMLPPLGVAVFVYDRRGSGKSGGKNIGDFNLLADDAVAAVRMLKADPRIGHARVGVWGLSQGGWLSLLAASRSQDVDFAVSISAPLVTPDVQMMFSSENSLRVNGYDQAEIDQMLATRKAVDDYAHGTGSQAGAQGRIDAAKDKPWFKYLYMGRTVTDHSIEGWRREMSHDPMHTVEGVHAPALILLGAADPVVPVATSMQRLGPVLASHPNLAAAVVAEADHYMQIGVDPKALLDPVQGADGAPNAPEYFGRLASWLTAEGLTRIRAR